MGPSAAQAGRATDTPKTGPDGAGKTLGARSADGDRVELSSTLGRLAQAISTYGNHRAERVQALAGDYQAGRFRPNIQATSRAIIAQALAAQG